jgi:hypothetical protein
MVDISPIRLKKRLKSLDARLQFFTLSKSEPIPIMLLLGCVALGGLIGLVVVGWGAY